jgi:hypothetical protein
MTNDGVRASFEGNTLERVALGDAINLLLHRAGLSIDVDGDHF